MSDRPNDIQDGVGRYASRSRINRTILSFTSDDLGGVATATKTLQLNGKIARIVIDPSRVKSTSTTATSGSLDILMDMQDAGGAQYPYCDTISFLDFRTTSNTPLHLQTSEGGNKNADGGTSSGLQFTVTAPSGSKTGGIVIDEPAPWNGLVCGNVLIKITTSAGTFDADTGDLRVVIIQE